MNTTYKSKPIPPDTLIFDLKPSRFLKPEDLIERWKVTHVAVTISRLSQEETIPSMSDIDPETRKPKVVMSTVMYFKTKTGEEFPRGMLISAKENVEALKSATGAENVGELIGKRITIIIGEHRKQPVLRISPDAPAPAKPNGKTPALRAGASEAEPEQQSAKPDDDLITAFTNLCISAGLDQETRTAILKDCGGDFQVAFDRVAEQYREILT
jgi:hypothetical protein